MVVDLLVRARAGDGQAFARLIDPYRRELHVHCYRILGSAQDAEDALQETLLSAWRGLGDFQERSTLRTWLYRIATSRCLDALRAASRRPQMDAPIFAFHPPEPTRMGDVFWLEPYPDLLLEGLTDPAPGPEARYEAREAISLAFVTALQLLPPRQRVVLVLRDVLGFRAGEVALMLETTEESVTSALKRARVALKRRLADSADHEPAPTPNSPAEHALMVRLTRAYESDDLDGLVALLSEDVWLRMPPVPLEYHGRELARTFFATVGFRKGRTYRLIPTRANTQPAFGVYVRDPNAETFHANGILVLTLAGRQISVMTRFDNGALPFFGLPRTLPPPTA
jgi:RNA polymerase sigma-70 factor (TIGR02960 family)